MPDEVVELLATDHSSEVARAATALLDGPHDDPTVAWPGPDAVTLEVPEIGEPNERHPQGSANEGDWLDEVLSAPNDDAMSEDL